MPKNKRSWEPVAVAPPALSNNQWLGLGIIGTILLAAGILQLFNFADFANNFAIAGINPPRLWAALVILGELWGAASFFKVRLSVAFRAVSNFWALAVGIFWFYASVHIAAINSEVVVYPSNMGSNYFGHFLSQSSGWLTIIEAAILLLAVLYALNISRRKPAKKKKK